MHTELARILDLIVADTVSHRLRPIVRYLEPICSPYRTSNIQDNRNGQHWEQQLCSTHKRILIWCIWQHAVRTVDHQHAFTMTCQADVSITDNHNHHMSFKLIDNPANVGFVEFFRNIFFLRNFHDRCVCVCASSNLVAVGVYHHHIISHFVLLINFYCSRVEKTLSFHSSVLCILLALHATGAVSGELYIFATIYHVNGETDADAALPVSAWEWSLVKRNIFRTMSLHETECTERGASRFSECIGGSVRPGDALCQTFVAVQGPVGTCIDSKIYTTSKAWKLVQAPQSFNDSSGTGDN